MSDDSEIEWTDATWNPVRGCLKVSPGCKNCYAETFAERFEGVKGHPYELGFAPRLAPDKLELPIRWRRPRNIFVNSMTDFFIHGRAGHRGHPWPYIGACFGVMALCGHHTFQLLTKGAQEMHGFLNTFDLDMCLAALTRAQPPVSTGRAFSEHVAKTMRAMGRDPHAMEWPPPNVWTGVSVEDRKYGLPRVRELQRMPGTRKFLSVEPLLEDLGPLDLTGIRWVIVGGESGHHARDLHIEWVRSIRDQCRAQGVAFFFKQWGGRPRRAGELVQLRARKGNDPAEFPPDLRVREFPPGMTPRIHTTVRTIKE